MLAFLRNKLLESVAFAPDTEGSGGGDDDLSLDDPVGEGDPPEDEQDNPDDAEFEADETPVEPPPAPQVARTPASEKFSRLRSRAQESERDRDRERQRADDAERRLRQIEMQMRPPPQQETPEQERARLEMMTSDERADYRVNKALSRFQEDQQVRAFQTQEQIDRQSFENECRSSPLAKRFSREVEDELTKIRASGGNVPRAAVLRYVVGRALIDKEERTREKRTTTAQTRESRARTRPTNSRGDVQTQRGNRGKSLEDRLDGVPI